MRIFIHQANGYFERQLCLKLKDDHEIYGTVSDDKTLKPDVYLKKTYPNTTQGIKEGILECDAIVFVLENGLEEARFSIKVLEGSMYKTPKIFVAISSYMSWANTKKNLIKNEDEDEDEADEDDEKGDEKQENGEKVGSDKLNYEDFMIDQVVTRKAHLAYNDFIEVEKRIRRAKNKVLYPVIIYPGLLYGMGELHLHKFFKEGWEGKKEKMGYLDKGDNYIPLIHVNDLAAITKGLMENPNEEEMYYFAVDESKLTQRAMIESIANEFRCGAGGLSEIEYEERYGKNELLSVDLKFTCSESINEMAFEWEAKEGMDKNIRKVRKQYEEGNGVTPMKICMFGRPNCGKTYYSEKIAKKYHIPHVQIKEVVEEYFLQEETLEKKVKELTPEKKVKEKKEKKEKTENDDEEGEGEGEGEGEKESEKEEEEEEGEEEEVKESEELIKTKMELEKIIDLKKKKNSSGKYPDEVIVKLIQWKLDQRECHNRGWVLDGFPKTVEQAKLFLKKTKPENVEEEEGEGESEEIKETIESSYLPDYILFLEATDELCEKRVVESGQSMDRYKKRIKLFKENNKEENGLLSYFEEVVVVSENMKQSITKRLSVSKEKVEGQEKGEVAGISDEAFMKIIRNFLGVPHYYGSKEEEEAEEEIKRRELESLEKKKLEVEKKKLEEIEEMEKLEALKLFKEQQAKLSEIREQEKEILKVKSVPLRNYLMDTVLPTLTKGLVEVCKVKPDDPVDYLANFLFKESEEKK